MTMPAGIGVLDRKLLRDAWGMRGQLVAIAAVIGAGVAMFVAYLSNFDSLQRTRDAYYERAHFADVFASAKRVPASLAPRFAAIPGVEAADTRVVVDVTLDVPGLAEPVTGRLISLTEPRGRPVNEVYLRRGRWPAADRPDEVVASEAFVDANRMAPGARIAALINGRYRSLTIVGVGLSPEYVYAIRPGEIFPDKRRFGVFWMNRRALASAFDMEGGFNDVSLRLARDGSTADVIAAVDRLLEPYGGLGAIPRDLQPSAWTLENELLQLETFGFFTPLIFFSVAAFVLNTALARALALQRAQIAALKALGCSNGQLAWHYVKLALLVSSVGAFVGVLVGAWLGAEMITLYNRFFRFPDLAFGLSWWVVAVSMIASLAAAALGAQAAVRRAVRVPPAEAMRPEAPVRYGISTIERVRGIRLAMGTRMIARNLERAPIRTFMSVVGIGFAVAILIVGLAFIDVMNALVDEQFGLLMRQDATVTFVDPRPAGILHDLAHLPGVMDVEPQRSVAVRLRHGVRYRTLAITGIVPAPRLSRVVDREGRDITMPPDGLVLSAMLADRLDLKAGDAVRVEVLEGRRQAFDVRIAALVDDSVGLQANMRLDALHRLLQESGVVTGAALTVDHAQLGRFYAAVKQTPTVAGVALRDVALRNFRETMAESMDLSILFNVMFATVIAFGVVYNAARVSLSERSRELASLRVLGFTRGEISVILFGELAVVTGCALPVGAVIGSVFGHLIMLAFNNEVYRLSFVMTSSTVAWSWLVTIAAVLASAFVVRRRIDQLDLVGVLKTGE